MQPVPVDESLPPSESPESERRGGDRVRVLIPAIVLCEDGSRFQCVIRDMSATGAKIGITRRHRLPERFKLIMDGRTHGYPMRRAWRRGDFAGLVLELGRA